MRYVINNARFRIFPAGSQASFLEGDALPVWNGTHQEITFSGRRIKRGLYRSATRLLLNAGVNGAANILRKSTHNLDPERVAKGLLASPWRVKPAGAVPHQNLPD